MKNEAPQYLAETLMAWEREPEPSEEALRLAHAAGETIPVGWRLLSEGADTRVRVYHAPGRVWGFYWTAPWLEGIQVDNNGETFHSLSACQTDAAFAFWERLAAEVMADSDRQAREGFEQDDADLGDTDA